MTNPTVNLSPFAGAGAQFFDNNGIPLSGGLLYTYSAGTTTPSATYTSTSGSTANSNPIVLDSSGRVPNEIWLVAGSTYKFILQNASTTQIGSWDNIPGINDFTSLYNAFSASTGSSLIGYQPPGSGAVTETVQTKLRQVINVDDYISVSDAGIGINQAILNIGSSGSGAIQFTPGKTYNISTPITCNTSGIVFEGQNAVINIASNMTYGLSISNESCEIRNMFFTHSAGVTVTAAISMTGGRHIFRNVLSLSQIWPIFISATALVESHFINLRVDNDPSGRNGTILQIAGLSLNNSINDSILNYSNLSINITGTLVQGLCISNTIMYGNNQAINASTMTYLAVSNCIFDANTLYGIFISNGMNNVVSNTWFAANGNNGIGVGTTSSVGGMQVIGCTFQNSGSYTGCNAVSLSGPNAIVMGNYVGSGINGGIVTQSTSQVIGNTITGGGTNIVATNTNATILGTLFVSQNISVNGSKGIFPQGVSGTATAGTNGATPSQVKGYVTVTFDDGSGLTNYKIPYYNV